MALDPTHDYVVFSRDNTATVERWTQFDKPLKAIHAADAQRQIADDIGLYPDGEYRLMGPSYVFPDNLVIWTFTIRNHTTTTRRVFDSGGDLVDPDRPSS